MCNASTASNSRSSCPPHFSGVRTIINHSFVLPYFPRFGKGKTLPIYCQITAIFVDNADPTDLEAHLSLVSCQVSLTYSTLIALRRDKTMIRRYYACFIQCSDTSLIHPQCTIFCDGCQRWRFSRFVPKLLFFFLKISCSNLCNFRIEFRCLCMVYFL